MHCYVLISESVDQSEVDELFQDAFKIRDSVWAVLSELGTCVDVCEALGMKDAENERTNSGVVFKVGMYYGLYDPALWQKLALWEEQ